MPEVLNIVSVVAAVATAVGVIIAAFQLNLAKGQSITTFEDQVAGQYREIARRLPVAALLGEALAATEQRSALADFYDYFDLSNEQAYLYKRGRIRKSTWREWSEGIAQNLDRPAFAAAWSDVQRRAPESFGELCEYLAETKHFADVTDVRITTESRKSQSAANASAEGIAVSGT